MELCRTLDTGRAGETEVAYTGNSRVELALKGLQSQLLLINSPESGKVLLGNAVLAITDLNQRGKDALPWS